jgi:hypothetical protein
MPMWWALPFNSHDEKLMRLLGYGDEWIDWMKHVHDQNTRTLIAMEVIKNAWKIGKKISYEYKNNDLFRRLFPEILPDSSCQWTADTMTHNRDHSKVSANQGEGTYEFTGVDAALQSKHYSRIVYDDLFGKEALKSELVANSTWEWFKLAVGAFDSDPNDPSAEIDEIVNGNRWSFHDLNWNIRKNLPNFRFNTHDAEGGCCSLHPPNTPIFPEEWTIDKLQGMRERLGEYFYSCQFRNSPIPPGGNVFKSDWLRYFMFKTIDIESVAPKTDKQYMEEYNERVKGVGTYGTLTYDIIMRDNNISKRHKAIRHQMNNGVLRKDIPTSKLSKMLLVDPNHSGEKGRANNCILELGINFDPLSIYVMDGFADNCSREDAVYEMYKMGENWRNRTIWVETSAGQAWLKTLLELENVNRKSLGKWYFYEVKEFKDNRSENAKADRIEDTEPFFRRGQIWINTCENSKFTKKFLEEYNEYPHCATRDILDTLGHGLQNIEHSSMSEQEIRSFVQNQQKQLQHMNASRNSITGY